MARKFFKKIIVAVNGRQSSVHAAMYGIMMAKTYGLELKFVYVVDTATIKFLSMNKLLITDEKVDFEERIKDDGQHYLNYASMIAATKGVKSETELKCGGVFTEIIKAAEEYEADLIIIGGNEKENQRGGIRRAVVGNDKNDILNNAKCPVLVVQKDDIEAVFKIF